MKTLSAAWIIVILGVSVDCDTTAYPERSALLSYSPARGEFPVASLFGHGYFSSIDESGNSKTVNFEPNPLHGVRINSEGLPLIEDARGVDLESAARQNAGDKEREKVKLDKLKPIKEFDERPFQDSLADKDIKLPPLAIWKQDLLDPSKGLHSLVVPTKNEIVGQAKQFFVFPTESSELVASVKVISNGPSSGVSEKLVQSVNVIEPGKPAQKPDLIFNPVTVGLTQMLSNPQPTTVIPAQIAFNYPLPTEGPHVQAKPGLGPSYLPPKPISGPVLINPGNPFLDPVPSTTPTIISPTLSTTSKPAPSTSSPFLPPAAPPITSTSPSFAPGNPFLPTPSTASAFPTPSPPPTVLAPRPPPKNPFLSPDIPKDQRPSWTTSTTTKPTPQFNADKMNPFLPSLSRTDLNPNEAATSPELGSPHLKSNSLADNQIAIPEQVKDTAEVEQAKREHFLAHQMAFARLKLAQQQDSIQQDETSLISSSHTTSPKPLCQAGQSMTVIPEPTEDSSLTTDVALLLV